MDVVVGGGIGGLALAQGLSRRGMDVTVLERDTDVLATGGYRVHLDPEACELLRRVLTAPQWAHLEAVSVTGDAFRAMHVTDRQLRVLARVPAGAGEHRLVGRRELRQVLASGLDDALVLGTRVTSWREEADHVVVSGGAREWRADLLVAADGVGSVVAARAAGFATSAPLDLVGLAGRVRGLTPWAAGAPAYLRHGPALALGPRGVGMFLTRHDAATPIEPPGWVWGLVLARPAAADPCTSLDEALKQLTGWSSWARALVAASEPASLGHYRFHAADPERPMFGWSSPLITALGDAVHAMPPTGGQSASTAIADAGDLLAALDEVTAGRRTPTAALAAYQRGVEERGRHRVRESLAPARWISRTRGLLGGAVLTGAASALRAGRLLARRP